MKGRPSKGRKTKSRRKTAKATRARTSKSKASSKSRKTSKAAAKRKTTRKSTQSAGGTASGKRTSRTSGRGRARKDVFGEGNYTASREFRRQQTAFVRRNRSNIPEMGEQAAQALEGAQRADLLEAERTARSHSAGDDEE